MPVSSPPRRLATTLAIIALVSWFVPAPQGAPQSPSPSVQDSAEPREGARPDFARLARQQADTDKRWLAASDGAMRMEKISYRSRDGLEIPAFVFQPLTSRGPRQHPALVWVHENIRGHLYEHYIPFIRQATAQGYVVIAPEYRGSVGYGKAFYDAIDYGGAEVDDVVGATSALARRYPLVDTTRIGIIGWSHGGMITLLSVFRYPTTFKAAVAMVPVTNLFHRLARKGVETQRRAIDPQNRFGGSPSERPDVYRDRSPLFHVDRLQIPLLVHVADNDDDVDIDEAMPLVDALRARKPALADVKIYHSPLGGHLFDRRVSAGSWQPENTAEQKDSWTRVWGFLDNNLQPPYN